MKLLLILASLPVVTLASVISICEERDLKLECSRLIQGHNPLGPGLVRLAFHDCVGPAGCNGCFENNADNAGLKKYADILEPKYKEIKDRYGSISRADFWILCSFVAIENAHKLSGRDLENPPRLTMKYGRVHCSNSTPYNPAPNDRYPSPHGRFNRTMEYFANEFNLTEEETIALLGAHNLGRARKENSGFINSWVRNEFAFENQFYKDILNVTWVQKNVGDSNTTKWQWVHNSTQDFLMFNSDIALAKDLRPDINGRVDESLDNIQRSNGYDLVERYANENAIWLQDFSLAYTKMIEKVSGDISLQAARDSACPSTTVGTIMPTTDDDNLSVSIHASTVYMVLFTLTVTLFTG